MLDDMKPKPFKYICYLCGKAIESKLKDDPMELSMDHVPPRQFYPKQIRGTQNLNLNLAPSHKICNENCKKDEEYFYLSLYPIVAKNNPQMGVLCSQDIQRRAQKPQIHSIIRRIQSTAVTTTEGGIHLPSGMARFTLDGGRLERVAAKIARGILFLSTERYFEEQQIISMDFYNDTSEIIEPYKDTLRLEPLAGVYPDVFAHSHINFQGKGFRLLLMLFWKAFMFCVTVKDAADKKI
jgi:hypothetical protein